MPARAVNRVCSVEGCDQEVRAKGLCPAHYQMNRKHGRLHRVIGVNEGKNCSWENCTNKARACGFCSGHYKAARKAGLLHEGKYTRDHPLYSLWWPRRKAKALCSEWIDDFPKFAADVGDRPGKDYSLVSLNDGLLSPDNFKWHPHLKQQPGESKSDFHARKWQQQKIVRPGWDNNRRLEKTYGIIRDQYDEMFASQNGLCAICKQPETRASHWTGIILRLAVDHCHKTNKNRELLCRRCNTMIGQIGESVELLDAMKAYLLKHGQR